MLAILNPGESVSAVMSGAASTVNPSYAVLWKEAFSLNSNNPVGSLNGATAVSLVAAPVQGTREVERIAIFNSDSAAVTVTISKVDDGTSYTLAKATIPVGGLLTVNGDGVQLVDSSGQLLQTFTENSGVGTAAANVTAAESGGLVRKTILTMTSLPVTVANTTGVSFGGTKVYDFPAGRILILGVTAAGITFDLTSVGNVTPINGTMGGDISLGSTPPSDGTLTVADVNLLPSTSIDPISAGVTGAALAASAQLDGTTDPIDAYFNILIDNADVADGASDVLLVSGTVTMHWILLGDY